MEPTSYQEAIAHPNKPKWKDAMEAEIGSLGYNDIWELEGS